MNGITSSEFGKIRSHRLQRGLIALVACGIAASLGSASAQGGIAVLTGGDAADGLALANVVQATSQVTYSQDRQNNFTPGGANVAWQGVSFGWHDATGNNASPVNGSATANLVSSMGESSAAVVPGGSGTLNLGSSPDDDALEEILSIVQTSEAINLTISGLTPATQYRIDLLVTTAGFNPRAARVGYNGGSTTDYNLESVSNTFYDIYDIVTADGTGKIVVNLTNGEYTGPGEFHDETGAAWNAVIVSSIPEPASMSILAGAAMLLVRRQRRN